MRLDADLPQRLTAFTAQYSMTNGVMCSPWALLLIRLPHQQLTRLHLQRGAPGRTSSRVLRGMVSACAIQGMTAVAHPDWSEHRWAARQTQQVAARCHVTG
jgi:hypothetical protein